MTDTLIILAAGASSRMKQSLKLKGGAPENTFHSKALIPLGKEQRPAVDYLIDHAIKAGYRHFIFVVNENSEAFRNYFGMKDSGNAYKGCSLSYAVQIIPSGREKPLGTADALSQVYDQYPSLKEKSVVVCNADNLYSVKALSILATSAEPNAFISYNREGLLFPISRIMSFALLIADEEGYLSHLIEKPKAQDSDQYQDASGQFRVSMNIWKFFGKDIYCHLQNCPLHPVRNEKELPTAVRMLIDQTPKIMKGYPLMEHVPDLTSAEDIAKVESYLNNNP